MKIWNKFNSTLEKLKYQYNLRILKIKNYLYQKRKWFKSIRYYTELVEKIGWDIILFLLTSVGAIAVLEWLSLKFVIPGVSPDNFRDILIAGIGIAGVFIALYCSNIVSVFSARYLRAPNEVFQLFINSFTASAGIKVILYYMVFSFCLLVSTMNLSCVSYVLVLPWSVFTGFIILIFGYLGQKTLEITDDSV